MKLTCFSNRISWPASQEPEWASGVERWYQLDAPAFALTEVFWKHRDQLQKRPTMMLLCSPGASNATDAQFALSAQPSPAKFVHTLPNIRSAALLQVMEWAGPVLCVQNDPNTILTGLYEGLSLGEEGGGPIWIVSYADLSGHIFVLDTDGPLKICKSPSQIMANAASHDKQWLSWISKAKSQPFQGNGLWIE